MVVTTARPDTRSPAFLAALASAAVLGLDPAAVRGVKADISADFDVAFVTDTEDRKWVVRAPRSPMAGARMESSVALLALLARRVPFQVPIPQGFAELPEGRAAVYPFLPGSPLRLSALPPGPGLAARFGEMLAALHTVDSRVYDEAGMPAYDSEAYRSRRLSDLDRAAATGQVPSTLLSRWESALDDVSLWRFAPTPTHGDLSGGQVLAVFSSDDDLTSGQISGITGWEEARVADPADDFATLVTIADPATVESVLEAYANARAEPTDPQLRRRARLAGELQLLSRLLAAVTSGTSELVRRYAGELRRLDDLVEPDDLDAPPPTVVAPKPVSLPTPSGEPIDGPDDDRPDLEATQPMPPGELPEPLPENTDATQELPKFTPSAGSEEPSASGADDQLEAPDPGDAADEMPAEDSDTSRESDKP